MPQRVLSTTLVFFCLQVCGSAQSGQATISEEIDASFGTAVRPVTVPAATAGFSLGFGPNAVRFEFGRTSLKQYGLGFGEAAAYSGTVISGSQLTDFNVSYLRDLHPSERHRFAIYAGGGMGYFRSQYTLSQTGCPIICFPTELTAYSQTTRTNNLGFGAQGGVRVPIRRGFGVRAGIEYWRILGSTAFEPIVGGYVSNSSVQTNPDNLLRITFGLYYRHH